MVERVSVSTLNLHRKCPQAWFYGKVLRLTSDGDEPACERDFGLWWHALRMAETLERGRKLESLIEIPNKLTTTDEGPTLDTKTATVKDVLAASESWFRRLPGEVKDEFIIRLGSPFTERLDAVYEMWKDRWREEIAGERPIATEIWFQRQIPGTEVNFGGFVDEIYTSEQYGTVISDTKSHRRLDNIDRVDELLDTQLNMYCWGLIPKLREWSIPLANTLRYDRVRMTSGKTPQLTQRGTLSKSIKDFNLKSYKKWVGEGVPYPGAKKDGSGQGVYFPEAEVLALLERQVSSWTRRTYMPVTKSAMQTHLLSAIETARAMRKSEERIEKYGDASRSFAKHCKWCEFKDLCFAEINGGSIAEEGNYSDFGLKVRPKGGRSAKGKK